MVRDYAKRFPFPSPGEEEKWYGTQEGQWNSTADVTCANLQDSGHPFSRTSSSGILEKEKGGRCTIHFSADPSNADLYFA